MLIETEPARLVLVAEDGEEVAVIAGLGSGVLEARVIKVVIGNDIPHGRRTALEVIQVRSDAPSEPGGTSSQRDASGRFAKKPAVESEPEGGR